MIRRVRCSTPGVLYFDVEVEVPSGADEDEALNLASDAAHNIIDGHDGAQVGQPSIVLYADLELRNVVFYPSQEGIDVEDLGGIGLE